MFIFNVFRSNVKSFLKTVLIFGIVSCVGTKVFGQTSSLVYLSNGKLVYTPYANEGQTNAVNTIPDFSYAGYMGGGVSLPVVPVVKTIMPVAAGADNTQSIQDAINYLSALPLNNGFRGAILLKAGRYPISGILNIVQSGVVLRGEGQGANGTVLYASATQQINLLNFTGPSSGSFKEVANTAQAITTAYIGVGDKSFEVANAAAFAVGDLISVKKTVNQKWIDDLGMSQTQLCGSVTAPDCVGWTASGYSIKHRRKITAIAGNTITVDIPIVDAIETQYGGGTVSKATENKMTMCGVENLRMESAYTSPTDEAHGWAAITFTRIANSWIKNVTAQYFGYTLVDISASDFNTVQDCAMLDYKSIITGSRRYGFTINDGIGNLIQRCYTREGRHDFVTGSQVTGPNVFLDCYADNTYADIGPHQRWAIGTLYDNIRGGQIRVQNRKNMGTGHGWAGAQTMFWNLKSYKDDIKVESPIGAKNWAIGCEAVAKSGAGFWESFNANVQPRSLYLQQLADRLGQQAVDNIAIEAQKTGKIYDLLNNWKGEGELVSTVTSPVIGESSWNITTGSNFTWLYNFGTGTGNGTYTLTGNSKSSVSDITTAGMLPKPVSGTVKIATASAGDASFALLGSGTKDSLQIQAANNGNLGKFSAYHTQGATALTTYNFSLNFENLTATRGDWNVAFGSNGGESSVFNNTAGIATSGTNSQPELFAALRFSVSAGNKMKVYYRDKPDVSATVALIALGDLVTRGTTSKFEVMCNNTLISQSYRKGNIDYTVPSGAYQLWIDNIRIAKAGSNFDFPANELAREKVLNSFLISGNNSQTNGTASNDANVIVSKYSMQFAMSALPVSLLSFNAKNESGKIYLHWQTVSESNNSHFNVLRFKEDGKQTMQLGQIKGKGNAIILVDYKFIDETPLMGTNYYQLQQVDFNGKSSLSKIVAVGNVLRPDDFFVYQNAQKIIIANINSVSAATALVTLTDVQGIKVSELNIQLQKGINAVELCQKPLNPGIYFASIKINTTQAVKKLLIR